jgi:transcriptional regulator with XRE-family HTH domain
MPNLGPDYVTLGKALKALRKSAGLTQVQAAAAVGIRGTSVSAIERGERGCRWTVLLRLLAVYDADLAALAAKIDS